MEVSGQSDRETYRFIVLGRNETEVLLTRSEAGFCFPQVTIPRWQRVAENLTLAIKREWGEEVICLFELSAEPPLDAAGNLQYEVAKHWRGFGKSAEPTRWICIDDLRGDSFVDPSDYSALQRSLAQCSAPVRDPGTGPFARFGWFQELCEWTGEVIASRGLHLNGNFRQLNASPFFSLIRFETNGPAVWFKAVGKPNQREFSLTLTLSDLFPRFLPTVLAARSEWHGWLTKEFEGSTLDNLADISLWKRAVESLGELQAQSVGRVDQLLSVGCRDLRCPILHQLVDPFMERMAELMKEQTKVTPRPLDRRDLLTLATQIKEAIATLAGLEIPDALGHLDMNPGNVLSSAERCVFLDWADAYVGPPFLTFEYLRAYVRRVSHDVALLESALAGSYAEQWTSRLAPETIVKAAELAQLVAVFAYASGTELWRDPARIVEVSMAGYFRSLTRRIHSEAEALAEKSPASFSIHAS